MHNTTQTFGSHHSSPCHPFLMALLLSAASGVVGLVGESHAAGARHWETYLLAGPAIRQVPDFSDVPDRPILATSWCCVWREPDDEDSLLSEKAAKYFPITQAMFGSSHQRAPFRTVSGMDYWKGKPVTFGGLSYHR